MLIFAYYKRTDRICLLGKREVEGKNIKSDKLGEKQIPLTHDPPMKTLEKELVRRLLPSPGPAVHTLTIPGANC